MTAGSFCLLFLLPLALCGCTAGAPPGTLLDGRLRPCPDTPNCVQSEIPGDRSTPPLFFTGNPHEAWSDLKSVIVSQGGVIKMDDTGYLWATFQSMIFRFIDDLECRLEPATGTIHIRSGARTGYYDFGVNRRRIDTIRDLFLQRRATNIVR